jgi:hypothetical protein
MNEDQHPFRRTLLVFTGCFTLGLHTSGTRWNVMPIRRPLLLTDRNVHCFSAHATYYQRRNTETWSSRYTWCGIVNPWSMQEKFAV